MADLHDGSAPRIPLEQQTAAVVREIGMRERVYPNWVRGGKMKQDKADHEVAAMRATLWTLNDYRAMQPKVLALSTVCLSLAKRLGIEQHDLDALLVRAETDAQAVLEQAT